MNKNRRPPTLADYVRLFELYRPANYRADAPTPIGTDFMFEQITELLSRQSVFNFCFPEALRMQALDYRERDHYTRTLFKQTRQRQELLDDVHERVILNIGFANKRRSE